MREDLQRFQSELDQANKELEKSRVSIDLERQELSSRLAAAENKFEKLKLKQGAGSDIEASNVIEKDNLAVEQGRREVEALKERMEWHKKASEASYNIILSRKARAENRVSSIQKGMEGFQARADRDGVVVYKVKWNGERYRVGETVWSGMPVIEIPELNTILAEALVPEVDIGTVRIGQHAEVSIDAFPGRSFSGTVKSARPARRLGDAAGDEHQGEDRDKLDRRLRRRSAESCAHNRGGSRGQSEDGHRLALTEGQAWGFEWY